MVSVAKTDLPVGPSDLVPNPRLAKLIADDLESGDSNPYRLMELIALDPCISARVIGTAARLQPSLPPNSLDHAAEILNISEVLRVAGRQAAAAALAEKDDAFVRDLWRHAATVALTAQVIAQQYSDLDCKWAYTAGLLHDIGRMAMYRVLAVDYSTLYTKALEERLPLRSFEQSHLHLDHCQLGVKLAQKLMLPMGLTTIIDMHHSPLAAAEVHPDYATMIYVVALADHIGHRIGGDIDFREPNEAEEIILAENLGIKKSKLAKISDEAEALVMETIGFMG